MRKIGTPLIALLVAILIAVSVLPWGLPGEANSDPSELRDGSVAVAENRTLTSRIYILRGGIPSEIYRESRYQEGKESQITATAADGDALYFLRTLADGSEWMLMQLEGNEARNVVRGNLKGGLGVTGLVVKDGIVWLTGVNDNGAVSAYRLSSDGELSLAAMLPVWWLRDIVSAEFDGEIYRVTTADGESYFMTPDGEKVLSEDAAQRPAPELVSTGTPWLLYKWYVLAGAVAVWLAVAVSVGIAALVSRKTRKLSVRLTALGGEVLLLTLAGGVAAVFCTVLRFAGLVPAVQAGRAVGIAAAAVWLVGLLLLRSQTAFVTRPVGALLRQMNDVVDGDTQPREITAGGDELASMNRAMQEMCMGLSIRDYEMNSTILSYKRFVPRQLTQMLDRAAVAEVSLGDSRRVAGNVGLFSVGNRDEVRAMLEDSDFVDFINHTFGIFYDCVQENNGCMISSALRLNNMETLFPNAAADGVRAGLDFLGRIGRESGTGVPSPKPMLILHKTSFLYGVAGREERLFPYLSSGELEFLGSFAPKFHESGVRLVVTEDYWVQIRDAGFAGRYIGFVSDGDSAAYKFYEVLDVYPEMERKLRIEYDRRFQEAINLFYRNDFFLARNLFSTLLRVCPEDGIVRWYLFACEHFFNRGGEEKVDYRLFGIEET